MKVQTAWLLFGPGRSGCFSLLGLLLSLLVVSSAQAAYLLEIDDDGADDGVLTFHPGFSFGGDTSTATQSGPSVAFGTSGADSIFGGDGTAIADTYVYTYAPDSQPDNLLLAPGQDLGEGDLASGEAGGGAGLYSVYATWPFGSDVSGGLTRYSVSTPGDAFSVDINQNDASDPGGVAGRGDVWVLLGQIQYTGGDITVTQAPTGSNTFVSQRAYGLLFESVSGTAPPPQTVSVPAMGLPALVLMALLLFFAGLAGRRGSVV